MGHLAGGMDMIVVVVVVVVVMGPVVGVRLTGAHVVGLAGMSVIELVGKSVHAMGAVEVGATNQWEVRRRKRRMVGGRQ